MRPSSTTETRFICPKCNGNYFGSYENGDDTRTYNCQERRHGSQCKFTVHGNDFWRCNARVTTVVVPFESHEEYVRSLNQGRAVHGQVP